MWIDWANIDSDVKEMRSGLSSLTKRQYMTGCDFQAKTISKFIQNSLLKLKTLRIDSLFTEMLGQHVINNGAIFIPFGTAVCFDHAIDGIH